MAIKAGQLIHIANQVLVDRAQTAGPGTVNINREKVYELGNYRSVGSVTDLPDLTFTLESLDASAELEAVLTGKSFGARRDTQTVTITGSPTGGDFTLTFNDGTTSATTAPIAFDATSAAVQAALTALANVDPGEVAVTGAAGGPYTVRFAGDLVASDVAALTSDGSGLTGGTAPDVTVTTGDSMVDGTAMRLDESLPLDVASQFKAGKTAAQPYDVVGSVAIPYLTLESMSYRFGLAENATQTATLRGDGLYYSPTGSVFIEEVPGTNAANQAIALSHPAYPYRGDTVAGTKYALSVTLSTGQRLTYGADYTENAVGVGDARTVTLTISDPVPASTIIRISYSSSDTAVYPQASHAIATAVRPAAIRGRNITVAINGVTINDRWTSVQSINLDWRVTLQRDEEFGNSQIVGQDFDVPEVSGSVVIKARDYTELYNRVRQATGVTGNEVVGALSGTPRPLYIELHSPEEAGTVLKSFYVPDARFNLPGFQGRVQQKLEVTFDWTSDSGELVIYKGAM